jgi:hypothetical protein
MMTRSIPRRPTRNPLEEPILQTEDDVKNVK